MTDRFEDAVRDAARNLTATNGGAPTYHDAWQRGRRRQLIKRSALAGAGALVLVAALMVNLGRVPGPRSNETEEVVAGAAATAPVVPTTAPVQSPVPTPAASSVLIPTPAAGSPQAALVPPTEPPVEATPVPSAANSTAIPTAVPPTAAPGVAATPVPTAKPGPTPLPAATAVPFDGSDPLPTADPDADAATQSIPPEGSGGTGPAPGSETGTGPAAEAPPAIAATGQRADAVVVGGFASGEGRPCDVNGDGVVDASCDLLADYPCTGAGDVRLGYTSVDDNGDLVADTCRAVGLTACDTNRDGLGDTPCIIELLPVPQSNIVDPAGEQAGPPQDPAEE